MRDYAEISKALRCCHLTSERGCAECPIGLNNNEKCANLLPDAADAIEELLAESADLVGQIKRSQEEIRKLDKELVTIRHQLPKWISVEERLPELGERVLVSNGGFVCESFLSQSGKWQRGGVDMFFMTPAHWMPLPKPPEEVER